MLRVADNAVHVLVSGDSNAGKARLPHVHLDLLRSVGCHTGNHVLPVLIGITGIIDNSELAVFLQDSFHLRKAGLNVLPEVYGLKGSCKCQLPIFEWKVLSISLNNPAPFPDFLFVCGCGFF